MFKAERNVLNHVRLPLLLLTQRGRQQASKQQDATIREGRVGHQKASWGKRPTPNDQKERGRSFSNLPRRQKHPAAREKDDFPSEGMHSSSSGASSRSRRPPQQRQGSSTGSSVAGGIVTVATEAAMLDSGRERLSHHTQ